MASWLRLTVGGVRAYMRDPVELDPGAERIDILSPDRIGRSPEASIEILNKTLSSEFPIIGPAARPFQVSGACPQDRPTEFISLEKTAKGSGIRLLYIYSEIRLVFRNLCYQTSAFESLEHPVPGFVGFQFEDLFPA